MTAFALGLVLFSALLHGSWITMLKVVEEPGRGFGRGVAGPSAGGDVGI